MKERESDLICEGTCVIIQRLNYKKVYRVTPTGTLSLGKEEIKMNTILGKPFWTKFQIISSQEQRGHGHKRNLPSTLVVADKYDSLEDLRGTIPSGYDNRFINDDGNSQRLSKEDILGFQNSGMTGREIISNLIENNTSFAEKTEYSQEKYIKKKEMKYHQYLTVRRPTIQLMHEIYLRQDPSKIYGLRMDTLAQIFCYSDIKSGDKFIVFDSGTAGLVPAGLLTKIGPSNSGHVIYLHSGDHLPQMPIYRAMNFPKEQFDRLVVSSIFDFLKMYYSKNQSENETTKTADIDKVTTEDKTVNNKQFVTDITDECEGKNSDSVNSNSSETKSTDELSVKGTTDECEGKGTDTVKSNNLKTKCIAEKLVTENLGESDGTDSDNVNSNISKTKCTDEPSATEIREDNEEITSANISSVSLKRKLTEDPEGPMVKKSRKVLAVEQAADLLSISKADGLVIIAKEHPLSIAQALLPFVKSSRPFVVYHTYREPLQELYVALKKQSNVINIKIFSNFLRSYQVLPDRTHPDILMNDCGGYILTGYTVS